MDTKEKKPVRRSANRRPDNRRSATAQRGAAPERRRRPSPNQRARTMPQKKTRVVRPPREDIPEVIYTLPKPFHKGRFLLKLVSVVAVVMAMVLALSIFFRVDTIQVSGTDQYTPWTVREAAGIDEGDSLLGVSKAKVAGRIIAKLPYVDQVKIGIHLPGTVNIEITELKVTYAIQASDSSWWLITSDGRVVDQIDTTAANGYTRILGLQIESSGKGQTVQAAQIQQVEQTPEETAKKTESTEETTEVTEGSEENTEPSDETSETVSEETTQPTENVPEQVPQSPVELPVQSSLTADQTLNIALEILQCLERSEVIGQIASIDVSDPANLTMEYGQRFHVIVGDAQRLEYKINYMAQAVKQLEPDLAGKLDVSFAFSEEALLTPVG